MTREEKREERIERLRNRAANARKESSELFERSSKMAEVIPFGQPIHVGHHSERSDRNYRNKIHDTMGRSVKASEKAEYYERKAEAAENNNAIYLDDENSVQKLEAKVESLTKQQEMMKSANKIVRNKKLSDVEKIDQLKEIGFSEQDAVSCMTPNYCGEIGFPSWQLSNNNAVIRNAKQRLEKATKFKTTENQEYEKDSIQSEAY